MSNIESIIHWRQWSVAIVLALFIALFSLTQFSLLAFSTSIGMGCFFLAFSLGWNIHVMILARSHSRLGRHGEVADGLLLLGLIFIFLGAFF